MQQKIISAPTDLYPSSDGKPMANGLASQTTDGTYTDNCAPFSGT